ncbi:MAG TPA: MerR family transcriptional regulator [Acidimicrobiales bacterium]|nr:MerR family transcriptional regulator [Acidimicrobiales bacterium]
MSRSTRPPQGRARGARSIHEIEAEPAAPDPVGEPESADVTRYRAEELAAAVGISVPLLRSYQSKGLLPAPRHEGRVAWYGPHHRERLLHIRNLKDRGYSLRMIAEALDDTDRSPWVADEHEVLRLTEVAERSGVPVAVLRALEASGLLRPHHLADGDRYTDADVRFVRNVLALLDVGLSLDDLMRIARRQLETSDALGRDVMDAWSQLVGARLRRAGREGAASGDHHADRVAESIRALAAIVGQLVGYRVERAVLDAAQQTIGAGGNDAEREALARLLGAPAPGEAPPRRAGGP